MAHPLTEEDVKAGRRMTQARSDESMDTASKIKRLRKLRAHFHPEARATGNPKEAALAAKLLRARRVIPMHFGTFPALTGRPEQLGKLVTDLETEVWALEPGETVEW